MRDGTHLATDVYLPGGKRRVPAVLARTPYDKRGNSVWFGAIGALFAEAGMAFVAQDTRGRYRSEGSLLPFEHEALDGYDTCEWIVRQPWSDGKIAVFGESYVGFTALAAAATGHPAIRAAALRATTSDVAQDWMRHQGVLRLEFVTIWALAAWSGPEIVAPEFDWATRPLSAHLPAIAPNRLQGVLDGWARGDGPARFWGGDHGWPSMVKEVRVPASFTTGWWDLFLRGALRDHASHAAQSSVGSILAVEATDHAGHDWSDGPSPDPLADWDTLASRMPTVLRGELAFLRKHLLGFDGGASSGSVSWMQTHAGMLHAESWPPPDTEQRRLFLADGGRARLGPEGGALAEVPDRIPVDARWVHDPQNLVPSLEGEAIAGWFHRPDERLTQVRDDVLTFTSDRLREPLDLAGPIVADLVAHAGSSGGHIMAKLCDVYPEGEARRIADGACLIRAGNAATSVHVDLGSTGYRVRPGHRLRLEISASAFPRYIWHPGTGEDPWLATRSRQSRQSVRTGPGGSSLLITIQPNAQ